MTVRSRHLAGPIALASGDNEIAVVPEDHTWLIKSLWLVNTSGSSRTVTIMLNDADANHRLWRAALAAGENVILTAWWALNPFEELIVNTSGTGPILNVFGADLVDLVT